MCHDDDDDDDGCVKIETYTLSLDYDASLRKMNQYVTSVMKAHINIHAPDLQKKDI